MHSKIKTGRIYLRHI